MVTQLTTETSFMSCSVLSIGNTGNESPVKTTELGAAENGNVTSSATVSLEEIKVMKESYREFITSLPKVCSPTICGLAYYEDNPEGENEEDSPFGIRVNVLDQDLIWCRDKDKSEDESSDEETEIELGSEDSEIRRRQKEIEFNWSIDQVAMLNPTEFSFEHQTTIYKEIDDSMLESRRKESEKYFSRSIILPSPELLNATGSINTGSINATSSMSHCSRLQNHCSANPCSCLFRTESMGTTDSGFHTQGMPSTNSFSANYTNYAYNCRSIKCVQLRKCGSKSMAITPSKIVDQSMAIWEDDVSNMSVIEMSSYKTPVTGTKGKKGKKKKLFNKENVMKSSVASPNVTSSSNHGAPTFDTPINKDAFEAMTDLPSPFTPIDHGRSNGPLKWTPPSDKEKLTSISTPSLSVIEYSDLGTKFDHDHRITFSDITNNCSPVGISPIANRHGHNNQHWDIGCETSPNPGHVCRNQKVTPIKNRTPSKLAHDNKQQLLKTSTPTLNWLSNSRSNFHPLIFAFCYFVL